MKKERKREVKEGDRRKKKEEIGGKRKEEIGVKRKEEIGGKRKEEIGAGHKCPQAATAVQLSKLRIYTLPIYYLHPSGTALSDPAVMEAINIPPVMNIEFSAISLPLLCAGADSAMYIGTDIEARPAYYADHY